MKIKLVLISNKNYPLCHLETWSLYSIPICDKKQSIFLYIEVLWNHFIRGAQYSWVAKFLLVHGDVVLWVINE
jgi:hypothetical protein